MVHGIIRRSSSFNTARISHLYENENTHTQKQMVLHYGDLSDSTCLVRLVNTIKPTEIYNLAAMSHVAVSFEMAEYTGDVDGLGTLRLLDAIRTSGLEDSCRYVLLLSASTKGGRGGFRRIGCSIRTHQNPHAAWAVMFFSI
jgi:GDPmannose 4,6-dehydratase